MIRCSRVVTSEGAAAPTRRLDRLTRQVERLERDQTITLEALGLFVRAWLTATPPLADSAQASAQAKGRERYDSFIETLGRRVQQGRSLAKEVLEDLEKTPNPGIKSNCHDPFSP